MTAAKKPIAPYMAIGLSTAITGIANRKQGNDIAVSNPTGNTRIMFE